MTEYNITNMRLASGVVRSGGTSALAYFDCEVLGFRFNNCHIMRRETGAIAVLPPMVKCGKERFRAVKFLEPRMFAEFYNAAMTAYEDLTNEPDDDGLRRAIGETMVIAGLGA